MAVNEGIEGEQIDKWKYLDYAQEVGSSYIVTTISTVQYKVTGMKFSYERHEMIAGTMILIEAEWVTCTYIDRETQRERKQQQTN